MSDITIILIAVLSFAAGCIVAAILSRVNDLKADELEPKPLGDMVNIVEFINRYKD